MEKQESSEIRSKSRRKQERPQNTFMKGFAVKCHSRTDVCASSCYMKGLGSLHCKPGHRGRGRGRERERGRGRGKIQKAELLRPAGTPAETALSSPTPQRSGTMKTMLFLTFSLKHKGTTSTPGGNLHSVSAVEPPIIIMFHALNSPDF